ncbi:hypothetical protein [uncultured Pseudoalteromonas sp.]|uniref:hypothetical protein n=1 Tax=uncultured Pseudoalteromonas sp. TaxID=114053 RepID=UPI0025957780|nr:hypothetical protein [uncultured Pseudoalteromonas sp.]
MSSPIDIKPQFAFVLHGADKGNIAAMTRHEIDDSGMKLGHYVAVEQCIKELSASGKPSKNDVALRPQNLLYHCEDKMMWYKQAHKGILWFRHGGVEFQIPVHYPALLFVVDQDVKATLRVYALASNQYPTVNTKLYNAPLMNISINGTVCLGTATLPSEISPTSACFSAVEETIFDSYFTHVNNSKTIKSKSSVDTSMLVKFWQDKSKQNEKVKASELVYFGKLGDLLGN